VLPKAPIDFAGTAFEIVIGVNTQGTKICTGIGMSQKQKSLALVKRG
jgi:hypothetical protein